MSHVDDEPFTEQYPADETKAQRPRRGSRDRDGAGGGSPLQQPRVRLLIAIGLVIVVILVLVSAIRGCQRDKLVSSYRTYLANANQIADASTTQGKSLRVLLDNENFEKPAQIRQKIQALATQAQNLVTRARALDPPERLQAPNRTLVTALEYRALGLGLLPAAIDAAVTGRDPAAQRTAISGPLQLHAASDVIYRTSYAGPTQDALQADDIKDAQVNPSEFFGGTLYNKTSPEGAAEVISNLKRVKPATGTAASGSGEPGQVHGLSLVSVFAVNGAERRQLTPGATVSLVQTPDLKFEVTVENGGDFVETNVDVTFTYLSKDLPADGASKKETIEQIDPGDAGRQKIEFPLPATAYFAGPSTIRVSVAPVPEEKSADNNVGEYTVDFNFQ